MQDIKQVVTEIIHLIVMYDVSPINSRALPFTVLNTHDIYTRSNGRFIGFSGALKKTNIYLISTIT